MIPTNPRSPIPTRRLLRPLLVLVTVALVAAACGDDDTTVTTGGPADTPTVSTPDDGGGTPDDGTDTGTPDDGGEPLGHGPYPVADLTVVVEHPDHPTVEYRVTCLGDTATITGDPDGVDGPGACTVLARPEVAQRLVDGPPTQRACTEIYGGPDTATITGTLDGAAVDTVVDRTNGCGIAEWDDLLAGFLPPARGVSFDY